MPVADENWPSDKETPEPDISKLETFKYWTPEMIGEYFTNQGYGDYQQNWTDHKINGERAVLLQRPHIEKMGVRELLAKLKAEYAGKPGLEIRDLRRAGVEVTAALYTASAGNGEYLLVS